MWPAFDGYEMPHPKCQLIEILLQTAVMLSARNKNKTFTIFSQHLIRYLQGDKGSSLGICWHFSLLALCESFSTSWNPEWKQCYSGVSINFWYVGFVDFRINSTNDYYYCHFAYKYGMSRHCEDKKANDKIRGVGAKREWREIRWSKHIQFDSSLVSTLSMSMA